MPSKIKKHGKIKWLGCVKKFDTRKQKLFATRSEALEWEVKTRKELEQGCQKIRTLSLGEWATEYLNYAQAKFATKTYKEKQTVFRLFFEKVKPESPVDTFLPRHALAYLQGQAEVRGGNASNKDRKNLVAGWNWGIKYYNFPMLNPFLVVDRFSEIRNPRYIPPEEDFWKVYGVAQGQDKIMLQCYLHLAARRSEIFRLTWADIDFVNASIRLGTRKRKDGTLEYDWLPMTSGLKAALMKWWDKRPIKDTEYVFVCLEETPFCREYYGKPFLKRQHLMSRLCKRAKVKPFGFHAIRHFTASVLFHEGQSLAVIQAVLRHKSPSTTERYLRKLGLENTREALEGVFKKRGPGKVIPFNKKEAPKVFASGA